MNRFSTIPGRDTQNMIFRSLKAHIYLVCSLSIFCSIRTNMIEPRLLSMRERQSMLIKCFHREGNRIIDGMTTSVIKQRLLSMRERENMWNVFFSPGDNHFCDVLSTDGEGPGPGSNSFHKKNQRRTSLGHPNELRNSATSAPSYVSP